MTILPSNFFQRDTLQVAQELLGKNLVRVTNGQVIKSQIVEVEAYDGPEDLASHASRGRQTPRNSVMYGPAGYWYVYIVYGLHFMLNVVTGDEGYPAAVLIRGVESAVGPGRLTKYFAVDKQINGQPASPVSGLYIEESHIWPESFRVVASPRIGVDYAGPVWSQKPFRFYIDGMIK